MIPLSTTNPTVAMQTSVDLLTNDPGCKQVLI